MNFVPYELMDKIEKIMKHYGSIAQRDKLEEEIDELENAFCMRDGEHVTDECADVLVLLLQFYTVDNALRERVEFKINRQLERIGYSGFHIYFELDDRKKQL